jgi:hypothetical protein
MCQCVCVLCLREESCSWSSRSRSSLMALSWRVALSEFGSHPPSSCQPDFPGTAGRLSRAPGPPPNSKWKAPDWLPVTGGRVDGLRRATRPRGHADTCRGGDTPVVVDRWQGAWLAMRCCAVCLLCPVPLGSARLVHSTFNPIWNGQVRPYITFSRSRHHRRTARLPTPPPQPQQGHSSSTSPSSSVHVLLGI